ncbi:hypothetical protein Tco_0322241 [Tanacetum coccineum]
MINEKSICPLLSIPLSCELVFDILDFFKDFVNEFPAIFYNDAQISKSDLLTESILSPQHIDAFDLNDETSLSEYDEEETKYMAPVPPHEQRHPFLRYQGLEYTDVDIANFEERLERIYRLFSTDGDFLGPPPSYTLIRDPVLRLCHRMIAHNIAGRSQAPKMVTVTDLFYLRGLDVGSVNIPYLLARYLRRFAAGRKSGDHISCGQFVARLPEHFGLLTAEILKGLMVIAPKLPVIDMAELASAPRVAQDAPAVDEGDQANLAPMQAPQQPPPPTPTTARTMPQRLGRLEEEVQADGGNGLTSEEIRWNFSGGHMLAFLRRLR